MNITTCEILASAIKRAEDSVEWNRENIESAQKTLEGYQRALFEGEREVRELKASLQEGV